MDSKKIKLLQVCRDSYPTFRVDLTELFSKEFIGFGHSVDWMMISEEAKDSQLIEVDHRERIFLGKSLAGTSFINRALNKPLTLLHDFKIIPQILKNNYDIVQVRDKTFASLLGLIVCKFNKAKFVYWMSYTFVEGDLIAAEDSWSRQSYLKAAYLWARSKITGFYLYKIIVPFADHTFV